MSCKLRPMGVISDELVKDFDEIFFNAGIVSTSSADVQFSASLY